MFCLHLFFFFQAEDGIRDVAVTGVQTCALPISSAPQRGAARRTPPAPGPARAGRPDESSCVLHTQTPGRRPLVRRGRSLAVISRDATGTMSRQVLAAAPARRLGRDR